MYLGAHESIAGGLHLALNRAADDGCDVLQIFTKNANQWNVKPLEPAAIEKFKAARAERKMPFVAAHDSYLINLASPDEKVWERSVEAFKLEMQRAEALGLEYLVFHPGSHKGKGLEDGLKRVARALNAVHAETEGYELMVLIETTAGQGSYVGSRFEEIAEIIRGVEDDERVGVCYDTCHTFAAGYDIRDEAAYEKTFAEFDDVLGPDRLKAFHLNDSLKGLGSNVDRHEQIGDGMLGPEAFRLLVNDPRFENVPGFLETPPLPSGEDSYKRNLGVLRGLIGREAIDVDKRRGLDRFS